MPVKIRLQRRGRKFAKIYTIVVADGRAPRDGKYIETLGQYNPGTNPATIELDFDKSLEWLLKGAQPTDTCRAILSHKGVMYKKHLLEGVKKGAFDEAEAERRFQSWVTDKEAKIQANSDKLQSEKDAEKKERLEAEAKIKEARALEIQKQRSALLKEAEEESAEQSEETPAVEAAAPEAAPAVEEKKEEPKAEAAEAPAEEAPAAEEKKEEPKATEAPVEEKTAETKEEAPAAEEKKEEPKAEEAVEAPAEEAKEETPAEAKEEASATEEKAEEPKNDEASEEEKK